MEEKISLKSHKNHVFVIDEWSNISDTIYMRLRETKHKEKRNDDFLRG